MRKTFTHIRNYLFLRRLIKNPKIITTKYDADNFIEGSIKIAKRLNWNNHMKGLLLRIIKSLRKTYPYKTGKYDNVKKKYEDYFRLENHIPSFQHLINKIIKGEEVYLFFNKNEAAVKGVRWCEYYLNGTSSQPGTIYKCVEVNKDTSGAVSYISYRSVKDQANSLLSDEYHYHSGSINKSFLQCYLYATEDQIETFDQKVERVKQLETLVSEKQTEVRKLQEEINLVCNFE